MTTTKKIERTLAPIQTQEESHKAIAARGEYLRIKQIRKQKMLMRKRIKVVRTFDLAHVEDSDVRWTCRTCGHSKIVLHRPGAKNQAQWLTPKRIQEAIASTAVKGRERFCDHCTKQKRDELYPLPPLPKTKAKAKPKTVKATR